MTTTPTDAAPPRRAAPMAPDERRAALVAATLPLLREHGAEVSTRQIARAAGVAEGTLFRVFENKEALLEAAVAAAVDLSPAVRALDALDRSGDLHATLLAAVQTLQAHLSDVFGMVAALGIARARPGRRIRPVNAEVLRALTDLLEPHREELAMPPDEVARLVRLLTFAGTHPHLSDGQPLGAATITRVVLDGVRC
jgi:AcrR family transcriptional regulator